MRIGSENHIAALHHRLTRILVYDSLIGRNIYTAIFLGCGKAEYMVILIDCATHGTERVVAVGHGVRYGKFLKT